MANYTRQSTGSDSISSRELSHVDRLMRCSSARRSVSGRSPRRCAPVTAAAAAVQRYWWINRRQLRRRLSSSKAQLGNSPGEDVAKQERHLSVRPSGWPSSRRPGGRTSEHRQGVTRQPPPLTVSSRRQVNLVARTINHSINAAPSTRRPVSSFIVLRYKDAAL